MPPISPSRLLRAIELSGLTPAEVARRADIPRSYLSMILKGDRRVERNEQVRQALADALDVPRDWIEELDDSAAVMRDWVELQKRWSKEVGQ